MENSMSVFKNSKLFMFVVVALLLVGVVSSAMLINQINESDSIRIDGGFRFAGSILLPATAHAEEGGSSNNAGGAGAIDVRMGSDGNITMESGDITFGDDSASGWNQLFERYRGIIIGFSGIATLTMLAAMIYFITKLGATAGNDQARRGAMLGIFFTGIATAMLGSVTLIMGFFYNAFSGLG